MVVLQVVVLVLVLAAGSSKRCTVAAGVSMTPLLLGRIVQLVQPVLLVQSVLLLPPGAEL